MIGFGGIYQISDIPHRENLPDTYLEIQIPALPRRMDASESLTHGISEHLWFALPFHPDQVGRDASEHDDQSHAGLKGSLVNGEDEQRRADDEEENGHPNMHLEQSGAKVRGQHPAGRGEDKRQTLRGRRKLGSFHLRYSWAATDAQKERDSVKLT